MLKSVNHRKGNMSINKYALRFIQLNKYSQFLVSYPRPGMSKFFSGVSDIVINEFPTGMLGHDMNISHIMSYAQ